IPRLKAVHHHVIAGLARIAEQHLLIDRSGAGRIAPWQFVGLPDGDGFRVELDRGGGSDETDDQRGGDDAARHDDLPACGFDWAWLADAVSLAQINPRERPRTLIGRIPSAALPWPVGELSCGRLAASVPRG